LSDSVYGQSADSADQVLDTTYEMFTPERVRFHYRLAGVASRTIAYAIDCFFKSVLLALTVHILKLFNASGWGLLGLCVFLIEWLYFFGFEVLWNGQSPGKHAMGLRVICENGTPLTWQQSLIRNLLRPADQLPVLYGVGGLAMVLSRCSQRLGDLAAGALVVMEDADPRWQTPEDEDREAEELLNGLPADLRRDRDLRRLVMLYGAKRGVLPPALRNELIQPLVPSLTARLGLSPDTDPDLLVRALHRALVRPAALSAEEVDERRL